MWKIALQAALMAATVPAPVMAEQVKPDVEVYYGDLDLARPADVVTLDRRLARAVKAACPSDDGVREMSRLRTIALCRAAKRAEVAPQRETALAGGRIDKTIFATAH